MNRCEACGRVFETLQGLRSHRSQPTSRPECQGIIQFSPPSLPHSANPPFTVSQGNTDHPQQSDPFQLSEDVDEEIFDRPPIIFEGDFFGPAHDDYEFDDIEEELVASDSSEDEDDFGGIQEDRYGDWGPARAHSTGLEDVGLDFDRDDADEMEPVTARQVLVGEADSL